MTQSYVLHGHLDSAAAPPLASDLLALRGDAICLDAGGVNFAGALSVQVLVAAHKQWCDDGVDFGISPISEPLAAACTGLGVPLIKIGGIQENIVSGAVAKGETVQ